MAVIALLDGDRLWFKARVGLEASETPIAQAFCLNAARAADLSIVTDTDADARFADDPPVSGEPGVRFFAGAPLRDEDGTPLGALCVLDRRPRPEGLTSLQAEALETLAAQVKAQLDLRRLARRQADVDALNRRALEASEYVGAWLWDVQSDQVTADARLARMFDVDPDKAANGAPLSDFLAALHQDDVDRVSREIANSLETRAPFESEYRLSRNGQTTWVLARGQPIQDENGAAVQFPGVAIDITQRKGVEAELALTIDALAASEARFRAIADSMPQMVWSTLPDGFHDYYNARWYEFTGVPAGTTDGEGWAGMFHPDDQARAWDRWRHSLATGDVYEIEYRLRHRSGVYRWTLGRAVPLKNEEGEIVRWFGTCTDIDDIKRMEQGKELLSQELSHRIKNIFAVVSALAALSARQHPEAREFVQSLRTRINALARAHEFVRPHTETSRPTVGTMTLHAFLEALFRPYGDVQGRPRVVLEGDDAVFDDQAATSVALLFHELATNAAKYGALSVDDGRVVLTTGRKDDRFILTWKEEGGPPAPPPERTGFGSSLANLSVEGQLGGRLERRWGDEGLTVVVDLPPTALARRRAAFKAK